jgi:hypothetical protein
MIVCIFLILPCFLSGNGRIHLVLRWEPADNALKIKDILLIKGGGIMGSLSKMFKALALTVMLSACATAIPQIPEKYALDKQLEQVNEIQDCRFNEWIEVDQQSLILRNRSDKYYLLVLQIPTYNIVFGEGVSFYRSTLRPNRCLRVGDYALFPVPQYTIERIYMIDDREQMHAIKDQLLGRNKG